MPLPSAARSGWAWAGAVWAGALLALWLGLSQPVAADVFHAGGLSFSDELGGFRILGVTGAGRLEDPFVVVEEVIDSSPAILVIRGLSQDYGNRIGSHHLTGFALNKVVINRTAMSWSRYELELREVREAHSPYGDGLSFGQGGEVGRPFVATGFAGNREVDEPYDTVIFDSGLIEPGEVATFSVVITDTTPASPIYVVQQPMQEVAGPAPDRRRMTPQLAAR